MDRENDEDIRAFVQHLTRHIDTTAQKLNEMEQELNTTKQKLSETELKVQSLSGEICAM